MQKRILSTIPLISPSFFILTLFLLVGSLNKAQAQVPANDNCANAITLTSAPSFSGTAGTTVGATQSLPAITCNEQTGTADDDVWYKFVAVATTHAIIVRDQDGFDPVVDVRSGACNGVSIGCADNLESDLKTATVSGLTIGSTYYIRVYSLGAEDFDRGTFTIGVTHITNDNCANAIALTSANTFSGIISTTGGATQSLPAITCNASTGTADDDVWYKFTAVATTHAIKVIGGQGFDPIIDVRSGACNGVSIACADNTTDSEEEALNVSGLTIGNTYYIRVYGYGDADINYSTFTIGVTHITNNDCANAIALTSANSFVGIAGSTVGATQNLPAITCNGRTGTADDDVWYKFTAVATTHTIKVIGGQGFDPVIDVRSGACNGTNIACADHTLDADEETLSVSGLTVGSTYYIRVYGYGNPGTFTIGIIHAINDDCTSAIALTSANSFSGTAGTTVGASQSLPAITCSGSTGTADDDVWYKFTAVSTTQIVKVIGDGEFNAIIDVRSGACNGTTIGCADATLEGGTEAVRLLNLTIGNTYYIRVYSSSNLDSKRGTFTIGVLHYPPAANDDCANAVALTPAVVFSGVAGSTMGATQSLPAITCGGETGSADDDVWYKFTAVATTHAITVAGGGFDAVIDVRSGACNGTTIACSNNTGVGVETAVVSGLTIGSTYYVRVYGSGNSEADRSTFMIGVTYVVNDNCTGAITLTSATSFAGTVGSTANTTESLPAIVCNTSKGPGTADDDVWYKFVAVSTVHTVTVIGEEGFDAAIDVRSGACNGVSIACADATVEEGEEEVPEIVTVSGLTIGSTYYIRVYSYGSDVFDRGEFTIGVTHIAPPANDNCSNAITLTADTPFVVGTTAGALQSLPAITCNATTGSADDDVWYKFVAVSTNQQVTVVGSDEFDAVIDVRSGACNGINIGCADATQKGAQETVSLSGLTIGSTYYVRVYSAGSEYTDRGTFTISAFTPVNDNCANAITLTSTTYVSTTKGMTLNATQSLPAITCNGTTGIADDDVWYKFVAVSTMHTVKVVGEGYFDAVIDVRSGACNGTNIACSDNEQSSGIEILNLSGLTIGSTYYIRVYGASNNGFDRGIFTISVTHITNDNCAGAITLTSATSFSGTTGITLGATQSLPAITCDDATGTADDDVWYKFVAVSTIHAVTVTDADLFFRPVIDVRSGACNGTTIACGNSTGTVTVSGLTIGSTYYIRVYGDGDADLDRGAFTIGVTHILNDNCANAITLTSATSFSGIAGMTVGATQSLPAITCDDATGTADDDVWYKFVAVTTTHTVKVIGGAGFDAVIDVRSGACNGTTIACADSTFSGQTETLSVSGLTIGATYYIRVYSTSDFEGGTFTIGVTHEGCDATLTITQPITNGTLTRKAIRITATNQVSGDKVTYQGGQSITLQPGFSAVTAAGNYFQAITGGCP